MMEHGLRGRRGRGRPLLLLVALVAAALVALPGTAGATNYQTYTDAGGDNKGAPDITTVHVSNDAAGNLTFELTLAGAPDISGAVLLGFVDSDQNASTGIPDIGGADYLINLVAGRVVLCHWNGTACDPNIGQPANAAFAYANGVLSFTLAPALIGVGPGFNFGFLSVQGDPNAGAIDGAPDIGLWNYQVVAGPPKLALGKLTVAPPVAAAGKPITVGVTVTRQDSGAPVTSGDVVCSATITKLGVVKGTGKWVNGVATCTFKIPKAPKGKPFKNVTIKGTITVGFEGATLKQSFSAKVK